MLTLSRKADYGLIALSELARRWAGGADPLSARELAVRFALPGALLTNVLKDLGKAKLVASTRGVHGGYRLALDPADISVIDVVTAVDGPIRLTACAEGLPIVGQGCDLMRHCPIRRPIVRLHGESVALLERTTLADLIEGEGEIEGEGAGPPPATRVPTRATGTDPRGGRSPRLAEPVASLADTPKLLEGVCSHAHATPDAPRA